MPRGIAQGANVIHGRRIINGPLPPDLFLPMAEDPVEQNILRRVVVVVVRQAPPPPLPP